METPTPERAFDAAHTTDVSPADSTDGPIHDPAPDVDAEEVTLVAVGCSSSKRDPDEPVPAKDLYDSNYWDKKRAYGEVVGDDWRIVSAGFGLLDPKAGIEYYDTSVGDLKYEFVESDRQTVDGDPVRTALDEWSVDVAFDLAEWVRPYAEASAAVDLQVLLGRSYHDALVSRGAYEPVRNLSDRVTVRFPFRTLDYSDGGGNGIQMGWMADEIEAAENDGGGGA